jgi:hypothetical protein
MHVALGIESREEAPEHLREAVTAWVGLFDSRVIPQPVVAS